MLQGIACIFDQPGVPMGLNSVTSFDTVCDVAPDVPKPATLGLAAHPSGQWPCDHHYHYHH